MNRRERLVRAARASRTFQGSAIRAVDLLESDRVAPGRWSEIQSPGFRMVFEHPLFLIRKTALDRRYSRMRNYLRWRCPEAFVQFKVDLQHVDHFLADETAQGGERICLQNLLDLLMHLAGIALGIGRPF